MGYNSSQEPAPIDTDFSHHTFIIPYQINTAIQFHHIA